MEGKPQFWDQCLSKRHTDKEDKQQEERGSSSAETHLPWLVQNHTRPACSPRLPGCSAASGCSAGCLLHAINECLLQIRFSELFLRMLHGLSHGAGLRDSGKPGHSCSFCTCSTLSIEGTQSYPEHTGIQRLITCALALKPLCMHHRLVRKTQHFKH